jgi:hypothetical protein
VRRLLVIFAAIATGCILTTSLDGLSTGAAAPPDAAPDDVVSADVVAPPIDAAPRPPLLADSFESTSATCEPWVGYQSTIAAYRSEAHSGGASCKVCSTKADSFTIDRSDNLDPAAKTGDVYIARAWLRRAPGSASQFNAGLTIRVFDDKGDELERSSSSSPAMDDTWQLVEARHAVNKTGRINAFVYTYNVAGPNVCFLVDDITLEKM